ncbi:MAG: DsbA family protein [Candidatus Woesearchaeota archaeon]
MMNSKILTAVLVVAVILASFWLGTVWQGPGAPAKGSVASTSKAGEDPSIGPKDAKVEMIIYSDFQCPFCSRVVPTIKKIEEEYGDKIRIVFRNFPLSFHANAQKAAEAGECANAQGNFWEMHDMMFAHQNALRIEDLKSYAGQLGLDQKKFDACLDNGEMKAEVERDFQDGTNSGIQGTPGFIINGERVAGALPFENFKEIIDKKLAES